MPTPSSNERTLLTYPFPGYARFLIFFSIAILAYAYMRLAPEAWLSPKDQHPDANGVMSFAWWLMLPITTLFFSFILAVGEGLFLIGRKLAKKKLEFDADNLYITYEGKERVVQLKDVLSLRLVYGKSLFDAARMPWYRYAIGFGDPQIPEEVVFTIFFKTRRRFSHFNQLVKQENPALQQKNWATSFDGLLGMFKRGNS